MHIGAKVLEHAMKIDGKLLEKRLKNIVTINYVQFDFMPGKCTIDAVFIQRSVQEEYLAKQKELHMCFVDQEKVFDRVLRKGVKWAMGKKVIPESLVIAVTSLY